jgi:hypothetical protein
MWVQILLKELKVHSPKSARLWYDNIRAKYLSINSVFHTRMKYIEVDYYFI